MASSSNKQLLDDGWHDSRQSRVTCEEGLDLPYPQNAECETNAAPLFWDSPAMHAEYGPFTQLYRAMAERFSNANQAAHDRDRARITQLPVAEQESRQVNTNALANKRKKRYKAAEQQATDEIAVNDRDEHSEEDVEAITASIAPMRSVKRTARAPRAVLESDEEASTVDTAPVHRFKRATHASRVVIVISDDE
jgi:hypothetical protein